MAEIVVVAASLSVWRDLGRLHGAHGRGNAEKEALMTSELHAHSCSSLYDGRGIPETRAKYAAERRLYGLTSLDHGTMAGSVKHYQVCKQLLSLPSYSRRHA